MFRDYVRCIFACETRQDKTRQDNEDKIRSDKTRQDKLMSHPPNDDQGTGVRAGARRGKTEQILLDSFRFF